MNRPLTWTLGQGALPAGVGFGERDAAGIPQPVADPHENSLERRVERYLADQVTTRSAPEIAQALDVAVNLLCARLARLTDTGRIIREGAPKAYRYKVTGGWW